jgi:hypothetical protein
MDCSPFNDADVAVPSISNMCGLLARIASAVAGAVGMTAQNRVTLGKAAPVQSCRDPTTSSKL